MRRRMRRRMSHYSRSSDGLFRFEYSIADQGGKTATRSTKARTTEASSASPLDTLFTQDEDITGNYPGIHGERLLIHENANEGSLI